ncbi:MAG: sigma-54-dependent transcriptional regulator [Planctomycetaceae bacterium]
MKAKTAGSLLVVDDDKQILDAMADYLRSLGHRTETALTCTEAMERMQEFPFEVVVCDVNLPDKDGFELLEWSRENTPETAVIMLTGFGTIESAVEAIRDGAFDYLTKPLIDQELQLSIERAIEKRQILEENRNLKAQLTEKFGVNNIIGHDFKMLKMFDVMESVARTRTNVLILGESGTGKTMTARAIHELSDRSEKPFVEVACGALPENLLESELFGHVEGAFTGASTNKIGKFLQAEGGTLFLDEVATASPALQVKLLRVLQDREFEPVGGTETHKVDVRLVLATNADLEELVQRGECREDLYYRINVVSLTQPPLRERIGDIPFITDHYFKAFCQQNGRDLKGISADAMRLLQEYAWPGNVRELVNVLERAVVLCRGNEVTRNDLPEKLTNESLAQAAIPAAASGNNSLKAALSAPEKQLIVDALEQNGWNRQATSRMLGINRTTLYKKMKKYGISFETHYAASMQ